MLCCAVPAPPFQNPKCGGQVIWNQTVTLGCVPLNPAVMQDFQDFVNFLAGGQRHFPADAQEEPVLSGTNICQSVVPGRTV